MVIYETGMFNISITKSGFEYTAGINGHKGSVIGDAPDFVQKL